tara:strand:- start:422 stop:601 length:180 start_codon:yes stop_codon:yes gene_type:complete
MNPFAVIKLVKSAKDVYDYVYKENNADKQLTAIIKEMSKLKKTLSTLQSKIKNMENNGV